MRARASIERDGVQPVACRVVLRSIAARHGICRRNFRSGALGRQAEFVVRKPAILPKIAQALKFGLHDFVRVVVSGGFSFTIILQRETFITVLFRCISGGVAAIRDNFESGKALGFGHFRVPRFNAYFLAHIANSVKHCFAS